MYDIDTLQFACDEESIYFVDDEEWMLYRVMKSGSHAELVAEEYPVSLYVFDGLDRIYVPTFGGDGEIISYDKTSLQRDVFTVEPK